MASQQLLGLLRSRATQIRSFTHSPFLSRRASIPSPRTDPIWTAKNKLAKEAASRAAPPPPASKRPQLSPSASAGIRSYASGFLGEAESLLLYKAPSNTALFTTSVVAGSGIFLWVKYVANGVFMEFTAPWYAKLVVLAGCLASAGMGAALLLTPHRLIKTISLVRTAEHTTMLRVHGTRFLPFMKPTVMDVAPGQLMIESVAHLHPGRGWYTIPMKNSSDWTQGKLTRPDAIHGNAFQRLKQRMLNISPTTFSLVRKMFNRDGMMYVRIGTNNWKMDLEGCEILESGQVLARLVREGAVRTSLASMATKGLRNSL